MTHSSRRRRYSGPGRQITFQIVQKSGVHVIMMCTVDKSNPSLNLKRAWVRRFSDADPPQPIP